MSKEIKKKQNRTVKLCILGLFAVIVAIGFWPERKKEERFPPPPGSTEEALPHQDPRFSAEKIRLSRLEEDNESFSEEMARLKLKIAQTQEDNQLLERKNEELFQKQSLHDLHLKTLSEKSKKADQIFSNPIEKEVSKTPQVQVWSKKSLLSKRNVETEIPAGTVVRCMLVSSADCSVGVQTSSDPNTVLLQPIANGKLPKKVQVALKGSRIIGTAVGNIASERVRIRTERLTLMLGSNGDFVDTSIAGFVSGEDGKEGIRGVVVDRSGAIITKAAFASFLQGVGQSVQATLNNQTLEKISKVGDTQSILDVDTFRNAGIGGGNTALNKLAEYYIKRAEQLQPVIQVSAGRIVDVVFLKTVKIGEKNIKKEIDQEKSTRSYS